MNMMITNLEMPRMYPEVGKTILPRSVELGPTEQPFVETARKQSTLKGVNPGVARKAQAKPAVTKNWIAENWRAEWWCRDDIVNIVVIAERDNRMREAVRNVEQHLVDTGARPWAGQKMTRGNDLIIGSEYFNPDDF